MRAGASAMALGAHHTCALLVGGDVKCWGRNDRGQLGTGDTSDRYSPASLILNLDPGEMATVGIICFGFFCVALVASDCVALVTSNDRTTGSKA